MTNRNAENDLYVVISPNAIKAVNQSMTAYSDTYTDGRKAFTSFWTWFIDDWDIKNPDGMLHIVKI